MHSIHSPLHWAYAMLLYIAVRCPDESTRQLVTYTCLVLCLAQKHGGSGWLDYDQTFRAQAASSPGVAWNAINPTLMASAVLSSTSVGTFCHLCQEVDHQATDCVLAALDPAPNLTNSSLRRRSLPQPSRRANRPSPYDPSVEVCRRFNCGQCPTPVRVATDVCAPTRTANARHMEQSPARFAPRHLSLEPPPRVGNHGQPGVPRPSHTTTICCGQHVALGFLVSSGQWSS